MTNRKDKPIGFRFVSAVAACLFIGSVVYVLVVGINLYVGAALAAAVLGLGAPSVMEGESLIEMVVGFFESILDGVMEVIEAVSEFLSSIFS